MKFHGFMLFSLVLGTTTDRFCFSIFCECAHAFPRSSPMCMTKRECAQEPHRTFSPPLRDLAVCWPFVRCMWIAQTFPDQNSPKLSTCTPALSTGPMREGYPNIDRWFRVGLDISPKHTKNTPKTHQNVEWWALLHKKHLWHN